MGTTSSTTGAPAPNYTSVESWWCITPLDGGVNPSAWVPGRAAGGSPTATPFHNQQATDAATVDVFYVHPTTAWTVHGHTGTGNVDSLEAAKQMTMLTVGGHASAFTSVGRIFAPKYRQAKLENFRTW